MLTGVFDGGNGADDSLIIGNVLLTVKRDIEINLSAIRFCQLHLLEFRGRGRRSEQLTLMRTLFPFRSTSVIASLLERDMMSKSDWYSNCSC